MRVVRFDFNDGQDVAYGVRDDFEEPVLVGDWFYLRTARSDRVAVSAVQVRCWLVYDDPRVEP